MRKAVLLLAVLVLAGSLWAADPIIGTWKLNAAKSKFPPTDKAPKEQTEVYRIVDGNKIELTLSGIEADGSRFSQTFIWPQQGGAVTLKPSWPDAPSYIEPKIDGEFYVVAMKNGKQVGIRHKAISRDGKTMRQTFTGIDEKDKLIEGLWFYDKQ
jgi:hypothetical protein